MNVDGYKEILRRFPSLVLYNDLLLREFLYLFDK